MIQWFYKGGELPSIEIGKPTERYLKLIACPETTGYDKASVLLASILPGGTTGLHKHPDNDEIIFFVGHGEGIIGRETVNIETDSVMVAPRGVEHECRNTSETETLKCFCVCIPPIELDASLMKLADKTSKYLNSK